MNNKKHCDRKYSHLAENEGEAKKRFEEYRTKDPFPHIQSSLLNSADIRAYVKKTALIYPFHKDCLKGASYDVRIRGEVVYWDEEGERRAISLEKKGDFFDLRPNSIAFVTLEPLFSIPDYLALRFNLKITHIYKGLLLGTGPLVDPGFVGRLSIPLHNLTSNTYRFRFGDELITMEFTKMSPNKNWNDDAPESSEEYIRNKIDANRSVREYIAKALKEDGLNTVISSIPSAMLESRKFVREAKTAAKKSEEITNRQALISIIAVCGLVLTSMGVSFGALSRANERYDSLMKEYQEYETKIYRLESKIEQLQKELEDVVRKFDEE